MYRGLTALPDKEVLELYKGPYISVDYLESHVRDGVHRVRKMQLFMVELVLIDYVFQDSSKMAQLADLFSVPEMSLLCNITEYFEQNNIDYHPDILFRDVKV